MPAVFDDNGDFVRWDTPEEVEENSYSEDPIEIQPDYEWYDGGDDASYEYVQSDPAKTPRHLGDKIRTLRYPISQKNNHYVRFFINVDEESQLITQNKVAVNGVKDNSDQNRTITGTNEALANTSVAVVASLAAASAVKALFTSKSAYRGSVGAGSAVLAGIVAYGAGSETLKLTKKLMRLAASITMYTPASVTSSYGMNYEINEDGLARLMQDSNVEAIEQAVKQAYDGGGAVGAGKALGSSLIRILASTNDTVSQLSRTALNKKKDVLFKDVHNREFSFDFQMAPQDKAEAIEVADIIFMFKMFAHPELLQGYGQYLYIYPAEFDIEYGFIDENGRDQRNDHINRISSCVLTNISVNYAPNGSYQSLRDGEPIIVNLSLRFKEIETLHQGRIAEGF